MDWKFIRIRYLPEKICSSIVDIYSLADYLCWKYVIIWPHIIGLTSYFRFHLSAYILIEFDAHHRSPVIIPLLLLHDAVVLIFDEGFEENFLEAHTVDYYLEDFGELLLGYVALVEGELFYATKELKFLSNLQLDVQVFEYLHNFVIVHGRLYMFLLLEAWSLTLFECPYRGAPIHFI